jgi:hypothetical protein
MANCDWCNKEFFPNREWQRFCCQDHQQRWHRRDRYQGAVQAASTLKNYNNSAVSKAVADIAENKPDFFFKPQRVPGEVMDALVPKREPFKRRI